MKGKAHFIAGGLVGAGVAQTVNADLPTSISLALLGGFAALVPDLDVKGTLSNKISINKKWAVSLLGFIGLALSLYSIFIASGLEQWLTLGSGVALLTMPPLIIRQKWMLFLTGIAVTAAGLYIQSTWLFMFGLYICAASNLSHRSLTHSIIGLCYFGLIGYFLEKDLQIHGIFLASSLSYLSHLILDMKWLPFNRRGIKPFQPFSNVEM